MLLKNEVSTEPTNNLDIYHATNMMKIVRRLCDELGKTVILVLHEINYFPGIAGSGQRVL